MRCLFCKTESGESRSVEHIIPESLGNKSYILPRGVVCDRCNNYFARKVEKPFLESTAILMLRFNEEIQNKRGLIPPSQGVLLPAFPANVERYAKGPVAASIELGPDAIVDLLARNTGTLVFPAEAPFPTGTVVSRFLAKVGLEALALRLVDFPDGLSYLSGEPQLDLIRFHARKGDHSNWPINVRRIYDTRQKWTDDSGDATQVVFEFDIFVTPANEYYFVLVLFGLELTINFGGPEIAGYLDWLAVNGGESPLYSSRNLRSTGLTPEFSS